MGGGFKREAGGPLLPRHDTLTTGGAKSATIHSMNLGLPELLVILAIIILVFGANRLPDLGRGIGRAIRNFKEATSDGRDKQD
jgi:sec-independent protein translocase protein TatA